METTTNRRLRTYVEESRQDDKSQQMMDWEIERMSRTDEQTTQGTRRQKTNNKRLDNSRQETTEDAKGSKQDNIRNERRNRRLNGMLNGRQKA